MILRIGASSWARLSAGLEQTPVFSFVRRQGILRKSASILRIGTNMRQRRYSAYLE
jgi:hypothetical protein